MKILKLTIKKKYFDEIKVGKKKTEYRWFNSYWNSRLMNKDGSLKKYDAVEFRNGYRNDSPKLLVEFLDSGFCMMITPLGKGMQWGIRLGNVINEKLVVK